MYVLRISRVCFQCCNHTQNITRHVVCHIYFKNHLVSIIQGAVSAPESVCTFPEREYSLAPGENRTPAPPTHTVVTVLTETQCRTGVLHCVSVPCIEWHSFYFHLPSLRGTGGVFADTPVLYLGGPKFENRPGCRSYWQVFGASLNFARKNGGKLSQNAGHYHYRRL
jgi:hypothetical protein